VAAPDGVEIVAEDLLGSNKPMGGLLRAGLLPGCELGHLYHSSSLPFIYMFCASYN